MRPPSITRMAGTDGANGRSPNPLHVVIVGAGIGGVAAAIACRRASPPLKVTVLERTPQIDTIGAGIHIPPNACRVLTHFGLLDRLRAAGGYEVENFTLRRYQDGRVLVEKPLKGRMEREYGAQWIAIHRGDYQKVLLAEALDAGADVVTNAEVTSIKSATDTQQTVVLKDGRRIQADVVIGADGLWSLVRETVLGRSFSPQETGDLAYRGTFTRELLHGLKNEQIDKIMEQSSIQVVGDDLPKGTRTSPGSLEEMASHFKDWDPILSDIIYCLKSPLKWKLLHFESLDHWSKGTIALLGDASHPTLPYQGQGAAMAVEDGAILGRLLDKLQDAGLPSDQAEKNACLSDLFRLYEKIRKRRTEVNVAGAVHTRHYYHLADGEEQQKRDIELAGLAATRWQGQCSFNWGDAEYQKSLLGFDVLADTERKFDEWWEAWKSGKGLDGHVDGKGAA